MCPMAKSRKPRKTQEEIENEIRLSCLYIGYDDCGQRYNNLVPTNGFYAPFEDSRSLLPACM